MKLTDDERAEVRALQKIAAAGAIDLAERHGDRRLVFVVVAFRPDMAGERNVMGSGIGHAADLVLVPDAGKTILEMAARTVGNVDVFDDRDIA